MSKIEEFVNALGFSKLDMGDMFTFDCVGCGACCQNREDVLLTPLDLFKLARHLNLSIGEVIAAYCDCYEGELSRLPLVSIRPGGYGQVCPFYHHGKCNVHAAKPYVCALYPLGIVVDGGTGEYAYILQPIECGAHTQTQTVRHWLEHVSLTADEDFIVMWHKYTHQFSETLTGQQDGGSAERAQLIFTKLYTKYDLERDFRPQFIRNCEEIGLLLRE